MKAARPVVLLAVTTMLASAPTAAFAANSGGGGGECGKVLVSGSSWFGGHGVDVKKNVRGANGTCVPRSVSNPLEQNGNGWDCLELAARFYATNGWATYIRSQSGSVDTALVTPNPSLTPYMNGGGFLPAPGDLIFEHYSDHGHVTVVDRVEGGKIYAVEQNATDSGRKVYSINKSAIGGAYNSGYVRGFFHANANPAPVLSAPAVPAPTVGGIKVTKSGKATIVRWTKIRSSVPVSRVEVNIGGKTKSASASSAGITLPKRYKAGSTVEVSVVAVSVVGPGAAKVKTLQIG